MPACAGRLPYVRRSSASSLSPADCVEATTTLTDRDVDLLVEMPDPVDNPAMLAAQLSERISRALQGRKIDVLLSAPNLQRQTIHDTAREQGVLL